MRQGNGASGFARAGEIAARRATNMAGDAARHRESAQLRLDAYGRYARILEAQLQVLESEEPDLERFAELAEERDHVAREIDTERQPLPETPDMDDLIASIRERLQDCRVTDAAVLKRLGELRDQTTTALNGMKKGRAARAGYMAPAGGAGGRNVDVKF